MLLELLVGTTVATLGSAAIDYLERNQKLNKKLNLAIGANYTDLDVYMKRQILDFIHDEIIHSAFSGETKCKLSYNQLGLYDLFELGFKEEMCDFFDNVSSNMFNEVRIYSKGLVFDISDYVLDAVRQGCTFTDKRMVA